MIKVFTTNKDGKIELTKDELKNLLDEAYWEGYKKATTTTYTYSTPNWTPYKWTITSASSTSDSSVYNSGQVGTVTLTNGTASSIEPKEG